MDKALTEGEMVIDMKSYLDDMAQDDLLRYYNEWFESIYTMDDVEWDD